MEPRVIIVGDGRLARTAELAHLLSDRFEVVTYDGDDPRRLEALIGEAPGPVSLLGVSAGASIALAAAARLAVDRVAICEPLLGLGIVEPISQPVLLVSCEESGERPRRTARALWRLLPDCQLRELACDEADPFVVAELFEDFLAVPALAGAAL